MGTAVLSGAAGMLACSGAAPSEDPSAPADDVEATDHVGVTASQAVCVNEENSYRVRFSTGSIVSGPRDGSGTPSELYSNGYPRLTGIRYLLLADGIAEGTLFFGDVPSGEVRSVPTGGGDWTTVFAPNVAATQGATPRAFQEDRLYVACADAQTNQTTIYSVAPDGGELALHLTLPAGFALCGLDAPFDAVWYAGVNADDHRELRFCKLDGTGEVVAHVLDCDAGANTSISCHRWGDRVYAYVESATTPSSQLWSYALDGSDEQLVRDFTSQRFAMGGRLGTLYLVDLGSFGLLSMDLADPQAPLATVGQVPQLSSQTKVSFVEVAGEAVWVTAYTADTDDQNALLTYRIDPASGEVAVMS